MAAPSGGGLEGRNLEADRRVREAEDRARDLAEQVSQVSVFERGEGSMYSNFIFYFKQDGILHVNVYL